MNGIEGNLSPNSATHPFDPMAKSPDHHRVLLENDKIRVLDTKVASGERTPVHAHEWPAALYAGAALWTNPIGPHYVENVGTDRSTHRGHRTQANQIASMHIQPLRPNPAVNRTPAGVAAPGEGFVGAGYLVR